MKCATCSIAFESRRLLTEYSAKMTHGLGGHGGGAHSPQGRRDHLWTHQRTSMSWWLNSLVKHGILNLRSQNLATAASLGIFFLNFLLLDRNSIKFIFSQSQKRRAMHGIVDRRKPESVLQRLNIGPRQCFKWLTGIICLLTGDSLMSKMLLFIHLLSHSTASHLV